MQRTRVVAVDERLVVDVVHDQIERAVAVEIAVRRAVGEARRRQPPRGRLVREAQAAVVVKRVVRERRRASSRSISLQEVDARCPVLRHLLHRLLRWRGRRCSPAT